MKFSILSHAGLYVEHGGAALMVDPWLVGSAYWRSWWNFPPVDVQRVKQLRPTHIFLTHIHWDHFHGPSLRLYSKDTHILYAEDRYDRIGRDLKAMGFRNVTAIPHAHDFELSPEFFIRPYVFFPFTDTALVIRSPATVILDANDCKIVGPPLQQLLSAFPRIDFALRSHSSANIRACVHYIGEAGEAVDDRQNYLNSFCNFMLAVRPRFAVPFASNHCHLHRDTLRFNSYIQTPLDVAVFFKQFRREHDLATQLEVMLPGSSWSEDDGFHLADTALFAQRDEAIERLSREQAATLERYYQQESTVRVSTDDVQKFFAEFFRALPWPARRAFKGKSVLMICESGAAPANWWIDPWNRRVTEAVPGDASAASMRVHIPAIVLRQSLRMNMFSHAGISKRVNFYATRKDMRRLRLFHFLLESYEAELLPIANNFSWRSLRCWARRWREPLLYLQITWLLCTGDKLIEIEQKLLRKTGERRSIQALRLSQSRS